MVWYKLIHTYLLLQNYTEGKRLLDHTIKLYGECYQSRLHSGIYYYLQQNYQLGAKYLEQALEHHPDSKICKRYLSLCKNTTISA